MIKRRNWLSLLLLPIAIWGLSGVLCQEVESCTIETGCQTKCCQVDVDCCLPEIENTVEKVSVSTERQTLASTDKYPATFPSRPYAIKCLSLQGYTAESVWQSIQSSIKLQC